MKLIASMLLVLSLPAVAAPVPSDIALAVFRSVIGNDSGAKVLCLELNGKDVPAELLSAVGNEHRPLALGSECKRVASQVIHSKTGKQACFVKVSNLATDAYGYTTVDVITYEGPLHSGSVSYSVKKGPAGSWLVELLRGNGVS